MKNKNKIRNLLITSSLLILLSGCAKDNKEIVTPNINTIPNESISITNENNTDKKEIINKDNTIKETVEIIGDKITDVYENTTQEDIKNTAEDIFDYGVNNVIEAGEIINDVYNSDEVQNNINSVKDKVSSKIKKYTE